MTPGTRVTLTTAVETLGRTFGPGAVFAIVSAAGPGRFNIGTKSGRVIVSCCPASKLKPSEPRQK